MNGIHDMGGMTCYGPVKPEENEPVFPDTERGRNARAVVRGRRRPQMHEALLYGARLLEPHLLDA